jgi:hypothetical protein
LFEVAIRALDEYLKIPVWLPAVLSLNEYGAGATLARCVHRAQDNFELGLSPG